MHSTLVFWNVLIDWAPYRFPAVERLFAAQRLCIVRDGRRNRRDMWREFICDASASQVRAHRMPTGMTASSARP